MLSLRGKYNESNIYVGLCASVNVYTSYSKLEKIKYITVKINFVFITKLVKIVLRKIQKIASEKTDYRKQSRHVSMLSA